MEMHFTTTIPERLEALSEELREIDRRLLRLTESMPADADGVLCGELCGGIEVVRTDLLGDAIETLASLAQLDESTAVRRYLEAVDRLERAGHRVAAERPTLGGPEAVAEYLLLRHQCLDQEILGAVYVDIHNRLIADVEIFRGTLDRLAVEPRVVLRQALERGASGLLLWHTHPSGDPRPTPEDLRFTRRLSASSRLLGIRLIDHLILGNAGCWVSLKRCGGWEAGGER
jgi:DNA repair protein RadC